MIVGMSSYAEVIDQNTFEQLWRATVTVTVTVTEYLF